MRQVRAKPIYGLLVGAVVAMIVMPIARAGASEGPQATAGASGKNQVQTLKRQVKTLKRQVKTRTIP